MCGRLPRFVGQVGSQGVQRGTAQVQAGRQCAFHLHVKPALDRARNELIRHHINHQAWQQTDQRKDRRQLDQQPAAKAATVKAQPQAQHDPANHQEQKARHRDIQRKQQLVIALVELPLIGSLRQQKQQHQAHGDHGSDPHAYGPAKGLAAFYRRTGGWKAHCVPSVLAPGGAACSSFSRSLTCAEIFHSRCPDTPIWKGRGN